MRRSFQATAHQEPVPHWLSTLYVTQADCTHLKARLYRGELHLYQSVTSSDPHAGVAPTTGHTVSRNETCMRLAGPSDAARPQCTHCQAGAAQRQAGDARLPATATWPVS